jgi:hypothetical protein
MLAAMADVRLPGDRRRFSEDTGQGMCTDSKQARACGRLDIVEKEDRVRPGFPYASEALNVTHPCVCFLSHAGFDRGYGPEDGRRRTRWRFLCNGERYSTRAAKWAGSNAGTLEERRKGRG